MAEFRENPIPRLAETQWVNGAPDGILVSMGGDDLLWPDRRLKRASRNGQWRKKEQEKEFLALGVSATL